MSECSDPFSSEYVSESKSEEELNDFKPDSEKYGVSKPKRIIIRAKIIND